MNNELRLLNEKLAREDRKICLAIDFAPAHLIANQKIPNLTNIKLVYIGRGLTDKLQPLDSAFIACLKNVYTMVPKIGRRQSLNRESARPIMLR